MYHYKSYLIVLVLGYPTSLAEANNGRGGFEKSCSLNVDEDLTKTNQPLMLSVKNHKYEWVLPEKNKKDSVINMTKEDRFVLFCPGENNDLKMLHKDGVVTSCKKNKLQLLRGPPIVTETKELQCSKQITPVIENTGKKCGDELKATIFEIGYQIDIIPQWFPMLSVCHDIETMDTLYSTYTMHGKSIEARQKNVPRPRQFYAGNLKELYDGDSPNIFYTKERVTETLREILHFDDVSEYVDSDKNFISRGHLTPDADMLLASWKITTYFFINVAPQWQTINAGNWLKVENKVRDAAEWLQDEFVVITGTYGVMKLVIGGKEEEIRLIPPHKLRIPDYFWKIIYSKSQQTAIAIMTSNNPYVERIEPLCGDICQEYGWGSEKFHDKQKGYTYCCTYTDFKNIVKYVPDIQVRGVLRMPPKPAIVRFRSAAKKVVKSLRRNKNRLRDKWNNKFNKNAPFTNIRTRPT